MFSDELKNVIIKTITSWQLLLVVALLIPYFLLVSYVAHLRARRRVVVMSKPRKPKKEKQVSAKSDEDEDNEEGEEKEEHDGPKRKST